jgi:hypothetical protein
VLDASLSELVFAAVLVGIVLLAQVAPRLGEMIGARFGSGRSPKASPPGDHGS